MSEAVRGLILAHAELAGALVGAVRTIVGDDGGLVALSNAGCDRAALAARLEGAMGAGPVLVFTDLAGGSCFTVAATVARGRPGTRVVSGVNLGMLLDFVGHPDESLDAAAERAGRAGRDAVREPGR